VSTVDEFQGEDIKNLGVRVMAQDAKCQLPEYRSCCCTCVFHLKDFHHCTTAWDLREAAGGCVCGIAKGWICAPPESDRAHSGWTEHGICEMHTNAKKVEL
jgi:hypothetical protein